MNTLIIQTPSEVTDSSLPIDYRDSQMNAGTLLAIDFRYSHCAPGASGTVANNAAINNLVEGGQTSIVSVGPNLNPSATYSAAGKRLSLLTKDENAGINAKALIDTQSIFNLKGSTQYNFGMVLWARISSEFWFPNGVSHSLIGFGKSGVASPNFIPAMLAAEKRRKNATLVDVTTNVITVPGHGWNDGTPVEVNGTALPGGTTAGTKYFVVQSTADTLKISTTVGGSEVDITTAGSGVYLMDDIFNFAFYNDLGPGSPSSRGASSSWLTAPDELFQIAVGWSVADGVATAEIIKNGGLARVTSTSNSNLVLPESGFDNLKIGFGIPPNSNVSSSAKLIVHRALLENLSISGRTLAEMAAADYAMNSGAFA